MDLAASVNHPAHYVILEFSRLLAQCFELDEHNATSLHKYAIWDTALGRGHEFEG
jgi:hypothetical protein